VNPPNGYVKEGPRKPSKNVSNINSWIMGKFIGALGTDIFRVIHTHFVCMLEEKSPKKAGVLLNIEPIFIHLNPVLCATFPAAKQFISLLGVSFDFFFKKIHTFTVLTHWGYQI
jgi:hypothetical protein